MEDDEDELIDNAWHQSPHWYWKVKPKLWVPTYKEAWEAQYVKAADEIKNMQNPSAAKKYYNIHPRQRRKWPYVSDHDKLWLGSAPEFYRMHWEKTVQEQHRRVAEARSLGSKEMEFQGWRTMYMRNVWLRKFRSQEQFQIKEILVYPERLNAENIERLQKPAHKAATLWFQLEPEIQELVWDAVLAVYKQVEWNRPHLLQESKDAGMTPWEIQTTMAENWADILFAQRKKRFDYLDRVNKEWWDEMIAYHQDQLEDEL